MKKGKIATLAAFCALFAALCLTACGDEGKENATPLPTNTAVQTETAKPTENPTEVPTVEPTAEPTEVPTVGPTEVPTIEPTEEPRKIPVYDFSNNHIRDISDELIVKMFLSVFPEKSDYKHNQYRFVYPGENGDAIDTSFVCYDIGDRFLLYFSGEHRRSNNEIYTFACFSYEGEYINTVYELDTWGEPYRGGSHKVFSIDNKLYFAFSTPEPINVYNIYRRGDNPFFIKEISADRAKDVWDESVYFPTVINYANVNSNVNLRTCYSAYLWKFNNDGVDMYFYNENDEEEGYDFIRHFSFEELLSDVDVTDW